MTKQEILDLNIELVGKGTEAEPYEVQTFKELITAINSYDENDQPSYVKIIEDINVSREMKYFEDPLEFNNCCKLYSDNRKTISKLSIRSSSGIIKKGSAGLFERIIDNIDFSNCTFLTGGAFYDYGGNATYQIKINNCRFSAVIKNIASGSTRLKLFNGGKQYLTINKCNFNFKLYGKFVLFSSMYMSDCNILLQSDDFQFCDSSTAIKLSYCGIIINNTIFKNPMSSFSFYGNPNNNYFVFNNCTTINSSNDVRFGTCTQTYYCLNNSDGISIDPDQATLISSSDLKDVDKLFELGFLP